jgi:hypothetical protein
MCRPCMLSRTITLKVSIIIISLLTTQISSHRWFKTIMWVVWVSGPYIYWNDQCRKLKRIYRLTIGNLAPSWECRPWQQSSWISHSEAWASRTYETDLQNKISNVTSSPIQKRPRSSTVLGRTQEPHHIETFWIFSGVVRNLFAKRGFSTRLKIGELRVTDVNGGQNLYFRELYLEHCRVGLGSGPSAGRVEKTSKSRESGQPCTNYDDTTRLIRMVVGSRIFEMLRFGSGHEKWTGPTLVKHYHEARMHAALQATSMGVINWCGHCHQH